MRIGKTHFLVLLVVTAVFSLSEVFGASSVKTVSLRIPFPDVGG